jgi:hypothetical protein
MFRFLIPLVLAVVLAPVGAGFAGTHPATSRTTLTIQFGLFFPPLESTINGPLVLTPTILIPPDESSRRDFEGEGNAPEELSYGLGIVRRTGTGTIVRFAYSYRPKSAVPIPGHFADGMPAEDSGFDTPSFQFSMTMVSLSVAKDVLVTGQSLHFYLGLGAATMFLKDTRGDAMTGNYGGFPILGAEFLWGQSISVYAEFQYHFTPSIEHEVSFRTDRGIVRGRAETSMSGPVISVGVSFW